MSIATHHMQNQFTGRSCLVHQITEASSIQFPTKRVAMLLINYIDLKKIYINYNYNKNKVVSLSF